MNDYIYYYLLAVNILAFVLFGADKQKAGVMPGGFRRKP